MQRFDRASLALLAIAAVFWSLFLAFVGLHLAAPSDGARIVGAGEMGGLQVAPFASYGLQENDAVIAVGGRSLESLAHALTDFSQPGSQGAFGQPVVYTVLRDGEQLDVPITLGPYPLGAIWAKDWGAIVVAIIIQLTMGFVFFKRPNEPIARAMFLASAAMVSATTWSIGLTIPDVVGKVGFWLYTVSSTGVYMLIWVGALHSILLFPMPWRPLARHRWIVPALYAVPYLTFAAVTLVLPSPDVLGWQQNMGQTTGYLQAAYGLAAIAAAFRSYRAARDPVSRAQVRWVATGFIFAFFWAFTFGILPELVLGYPLLNWSILALVGLAFPLAFAVAILRYRLFDIDVIINRTLVYGALSAIVVGLYVLVVGALGALFQARGSLLLSLLATGLVAVFFQPLRDRLQRAVNRMMYGERDDPYAVLSRLGQRLESTLAPTSILPAIVETVAQALKLPYAAITLRDADADRVAAAFGLPTANTIVLPLAHQHELIGHLHVAQRSADEPFTLAEQRLLGDIARQIGVAAHNVRLTADLQRSRERLVTAREEERRRIRRDLHDGLGPALASQSLKVGAVRSMLNRRLPALGDAGRELAPADAALAELERDIAAALGDIRRLVYDLRPPTLDELGLAAAIRESTARYTPPSDLPHALRITVEAPERLPPLPAATEVAAFRIVQEALTNVVRHARARQCVIRLALDGDLRLEIRDDGIGLPAEPRAGVGLASMRERAEELGGACEMEPAPGGGTRVVARLPIVHET